MLKEFGGGRDVGDVHLLPVFDGRLVVPDALGKARKELGLEGGAEFARLITAVLEAAEEVGEHLVDGARAEIAEGQSLRTKRNDRIS